MEDKLIIVNNNEIELTSEGTKLVKKMLKTKIELQKMEDQLKEMFLEHFEETGESKYVSPDGTFKATYYKASKTERFDSKKFKEQHEDLYNEYLVSSDKKAYVKFN